MSMSTIMPGTWSFDKKCTQHTYVLPFSSPFSLSHFFLGRSKPSKCVRWRQIFLSFEIVSFRAHTHSSTIAFITLYTHSIAIQIHKRRNGSGSTSSSTQIHGRMQVFGFCLGFWFFILNVVTSSGFHFLVPRCPFRKRQTTTGRSKKATELKTLHTKQANPVRTR